jgi:tetratricopeptide (TPR) repeat protein
MRRAGETREGMPGEGAVSTAGAGALTWRALTVLFLSLAAQLVCASWERREAERALGREPENADVVLRYAHVLAREGDLDTAAKYASRVIEMAPKYMDAHLLLARIDAWQQRYEAALERLSLILSHEPEHPEALQLKMDILLWMGDARSSAALIEERIAAEGESADLYYLLAQAEREQLKYLKAYKHAKKALALDPNHRGARAIVEETRLLTYTANHEIEYYDFEGTVAGPDRFGYGLNLAATLFTAARFSVTFLNEARYRFQTANNLAGLALTYRPARFMDLSLMGALGAPAEVVSRVKAKATLRTDVTKRADVALSYGFDLLPWPDRDPGNLQRAFLDVGVNAHKRVRLGAGYTLGLLNYCDEDPIVSHSGYFSVKWIGDVVSVQCLYSYGQEHDPLSVGVVDLRSCEEIAAVERASRGAYGFSLTGIRIHTGGLQLNWHFTRTVTLIWGYRLDLRTSNRNDLVTDAHIMNVGASVWF